MLKSIILLICIYFIFSLFIILYTNNLKKKFQMGYTCNDFLNKTLFKISFIKACLWNLSHIFIYFVICILINSKLDIIKHTIVFLVGVFWYLSAPYKSKETNNPYKCDNVVYDDINKPRLDDLIFNTIGQLLYVIIYIIKKD